MNLERIKKLALENGFSLKQQPDGGMELNPYVYDFAKALIEEAKAEAIPDGYQLVKKRRPLAGNDQVDFTQAPLWAKYWLKDTNGKSWWLNKKPTFDNDINCFLFPFSFKAEEAPDFGYKGAAEKSLTARNALEQTPSTSTEN